MAQNRNYGEEIIQLGMGWSKITGNKARNGRKREQGKGIIQLGMGWSKMGRNTGG
jgi:hypothetical protein